MGAAVFFNRRVTSIRQLSIVDLYAELASLECACGGPRIMVGHDAITAYWGQRFREKPAGELVDLQHTGPDIVVGYRVPDGVVQALLRFDDVGKIERSRCGPFSGGAHSWARN
jgi:hypothetical protein